VGFQFPKVYRINGKIQPNGANFKSYLDGQVQDSVSGKTAHADPLCKLQNGLEFVEQIAYLVLQLALRGFKKSIEAIKLGKGFETVSNGLHLGIIN
jgi:hypothetical protein